MDKPPSPAMQFVADHRDLLFKHARAHVRAASELVAAEDVAREIELELSQLEGARGLNLANARSPDAVLRGIVKHAAGRARRRRKLIEQVAAGDDLQAVSEDLALLDSDLPDVRLDVTAEATGARAKLDAVKARLAPRDALVFAALIEDDATVDDVADALSMPVQEIENARARILEEATAAGIEPVPWPSRGAG